MNTKKNLTTEQAMGRALIYTRIENDDPCCLFSSCRDGLYHFVVATAYLKYEFYVDAEDGTVLGIDTEPLLYPEAMLFCECGDDAQPAVA